MIDNFALLISHGLMIVVAIRLLSRGDLDDEAAPGERGASRWGRRPRA